MKLSFKPTGLRAPAPGPTEVVSGTVLLRPPGCEPSAPREVQTLRPPRAPRVRAKATIPTSS